MRITRYIVENLGKEAIRPLARFVVEVSNVLNGGVKLRDQLAGDFKEIRYVGGETLKVSSSAKLRPLAVWCLRAKEAASDTGATMSGNAVTWTYGDGTIIISGISGLTASTDYAVTLAIVEG